MSSIYHIKTIFLTVILFMVVSVESGLLSQSLDTDTNGDKYTQVIDIDLKVFPNPATEYVVVSTDHKFNGRYKLNNIFGKVLLEGKLDNEGQKIELLKFRTGIYIISIYDESGQKLGARKIIKN